MHEPIIANLPQSRVEMKFIVTPDEAQPYLDQAAIDAQNAKPIQGFRPGKAPYEEVKKAVGEMRLWEAALERIVRARYVHTVLEKQIDTVGSPEISVEQLVPGQDLKFTVRATVMPNVVTLMDYDKPLVTKKSPTVSDADVDKSVEELRTMRRQEVIVARPATKEDMALIDLEIKKDNVQIEGGASHNYKVYLNEEHYIPGFADQLVGLKKGDTKTFTLSFPAEHYQKQLAGQSVDFSVTVNDIFELTLPTLDDAFTQTLGIDSVEKLRELIKTNLAKEAQQKVDEASEIELLEKLVKGSKFSEVPELLVNEEVRRMFSELQHAAESQGMNFADYLSQLKKSADDIKLDMVPRAIERVQTAVLIKEIAGKEKVSVTDEELDAEIDHILQSVEDKETKERVASPEYRDYVVMQMKNRKTLEMLKAKAIKEE